MVQGEKGDLSIIKLGGNGGGHVANVNRWRGQIGLGDLEDRDLATTMKVKKGAAGEFVYVKLINDEKPEMAIIGSMIPGPDYVLYVKLTASKAGVLEVEKDFIAFSATVREDHTGNSHE